MFQPVGIVALGKVFARVRAAAFLARQRAFDERFGEVIYAWVEPADAQTVDETDVIAHVKGRLAGYKAPRRVLTTPSIGPRTLSRAVRQITAAGCASATGLSCRQGQ